MKNEYSRRDVLKLFGAGALLSPLCRSAMSSAATTPFRFNYVVATNQFGKEPLEKILAVVKQLGTDTIDLWGEHWANQREQVAEMGVDAFRKLLDKYGVKLGCITAFQQKNFKLEDEIRFLHRFGGNTVVIGTPGYQKGPPPEAPKDAIARFITHHLPAIRLAEELGMKIACENHLGNVTEPPDGLRLFIDEIQQYPALGLALAPRHLPQDARPLGDIIRYCGKKLFFYYAWQATNDRKDLTVEERERTQLPGVGKLDFKPMIDTLKEIDFRGYTEIFMHPVPRGRMICDSFEETVAALNASRKYLESL
jgi:sugar phosphate isomerase/epimerase